MIRDLYLFGGGLVAVGLVLMAVLRRRLRSGVPVRVGAGLWRSRKVRRG